MGQGRDLHALSQLAPVAPVGNWRTLTLLVHNLENEHLSGDVVISTRAVKEHRLLTLLALVDEREMVGHTCSCPVIQSMMWNKITWISLRQHRVHVKDQLASWKHSKLASQRLQQTLKWVQEELWSRGENRRQSQPWGQKTCASDHHHHLQSLSVVQHVDKASEWYDMKISRTCHITKRGKVQCGWILMLQVTGSFHVSGTLTRGHSLTPKAGKETAEATQYNNCIEKLPDKYDLQLSLCY